EPRWLCSASTLQVKQHSSILLTFENPSDADRLLHTDRGAMMYGRFARASRYTDVKPVRQCRRCWSLDHPTSDCKRRDPACRLCAGNHHERQHNCAQCQ
ncbi:hypothetical protein BD410DRAFT_701655, partial [Rickenella mellea]